MTLEALAHTAGLTTNTLGRIERVQADPGWTTVRALALALAVPLAELAEGVEGAEASGRK